LLFHAAISLVIDKRDNGIDTSATAFYSLRPLLSGVFTMYAIIETGGKQYRVQSGDKLEVEKLETDKGGEVTFDKVLLVADGDNVTVGRPLVKGARVTAEVLDQFKDDKVIAYKFRRREGYHRTRGHRQQLTQLKIKEIVAK
jgi:large subunit ribosomal protein L21